ncbi:hypothetical protein OG194_18785 [Streptomyces sp. NBC_01288]|uniref:helix-turn-helix domain-containing protein n=1 Tax=Streptomyces sp. NBC_01288 TaxID=2903814 RepID=UPI002E1032B6|nr:hypothetical protein OG194_18785 [Streptomyces sp. NBC_01288]
MPEIALDAKIQAIARLARGESTDAVGTAVGVNGRTVRRWREDTTFEADVQAARRALLTEARAALGAAARDAVTALHEALTDDSAAVRVRAASVLLGALPAFAEHVDLEERLTALEAAITEQRSIA